MSALGLDRLIARIPLAARALAAIAVLCGLILAMVVERASVLRSGATVKLATEPVDPRDLFRGDYVVLNYGISSLNLTRLAASGEYERNSTLFVGLRADADGVARPVRVARADEPRDPSLIWLAGKVGYQTGCPARRDETEPCAPGDKVLRMTYGLESYFVPQGQGRTIETTEASRVHILAAVTPGGRSAIKSLLIDGKPVYDEPPF